MNNKTKDSSSEFITHKSQGGEKKKKSCCADKPVPLRQETAQDMNHTQLIIFHHSTIS